MDSCCRGNDRERLLGFAARCNARWGIDSGRFNAGELLFHRSAAGLLSITFSAPPISFSAACHAAAPPPLGERELNCFWLIKALDFQPIVSKPGAAPAPGLRQA
jgi:hypothetical protein